MLNIATQFIASRLEKSWLSGVFISFFLALGLSGCATVQRPTVYDFGPGAVAPVPSQRMAGLPALVVADVEAPTALDGTAVMYRLVYADAQQLRPYALARWSMPPAQLVRQRLREQLGLRRMLLSPGDAGAAVAGTLRVEVEEFSHLFASADTSAGIVRLRASFQRTLPGGERVLVQRSFVLQRPAGSQDATGGVRALAAATDAVIAELDAWLQQTTEAP